MKKTSYAIISFFACVLLLSPDIGFTAANDTCSQGVGVPPFLASGAKPNLLMVLDNSGSMLDAAYSKTGTIPGASNTSGGNAVTYQRCMDGDYQIVDYNNQGVATTLATVTGYDYTTTYGGYFKKDSWYKWTTTSNAYPTWQNNTTYAVGSRVYAYGNIYVATAVNAANGKSSGTSIDTDTGIAWDRLFYLPNWVNKIPYPANSFVWYGSQLYYTANGGTSLGTDLPTDTGVKDWVAVDSTWQSNVTYQQNNIVTYKGIFYQAKSSNTGKIPDQYSVGASATWTSLRQEALQEVADQATACPSAATGETAYSRTDNSAVTLCLKMNNTAVPQQVTSFAAKGNFLNWAMSSKFDVEKKILTGGKYNYYEGVMVGEHRGCSGQRMIKQVKLDNNAGYLSLGVRGSKYDTNTLPMMQDRIDSTDDTTRLEILSITATGLRPSGACQDMLTTITTQTQSGANWSSAINTCLDTFPSTNVVFNQQRAMLNESLQFCSKLYSSNLRNTTVIQKNCSDLYATYPPSTLEPAYGAYLCYGIYDAKITDPAKRAGYVGRCWQPAISNIVNCVPVPARSGYADLVVYKYPTTGNSDRYMNKDGYVWKCSGNNDTQCTAANTTNWGTLYAYSNSNFPTSIVNPGCTPGSSIGSTTPAGWENASNSTAVTDCIVQASIDYCNDTSVPEVIDPSDQAGDTTKYWNIPGVLTDSQIIAQMGGTNPLAVIKGYILQQNMQNPIRPAGILQGVKNDLRLGVMSFNSVGAATECQTSYLTTGVSRYCPVGNKDGAQLLYYNNGTTSRQLTLDAGNVVEATDSTYASGSRLQVDELAEAVNSIRATSWTPLGEALYSALGYYTQNSQFCLNNNASNTCQDFPVNNDPVQFWCQSNNILLITEGESTTDVNPSVKAFATLNPVPSGDAHLLSPQSSCTGINCTCTADNLAGDTNLPAPPANSLQVCSSDSLYSSPYLDPMTLWGYKAWPLYQKRCLSDPDGNYKEKKNIFTYVVSTGTLTSSGTTECSPDVLMKNAAAYGGTGTYYPGNDPQKLQDSLYAVLSDILSRASAGSAASVISSSRSGSGAVYQAVFWPNSKDVDGNKVAWVGDVHALFVSSDGLMYEDTDQDGKLVPVANGGLDKRVIFYFSGKANKTRGCYTALQNGQCSDDATYDICPQNNPGSTGSSNCVEIPNVNYLWSANNQLRAMNVATDRKLLTWNDANNNGIVDSDELINLGATTTLTGSKWLAPNWNTLNSTAASITGTAARGPVTKDFLTADDLDNFITQVNDSTKSTSANYSINEQNALNALIGWLKGTDQLNTETATDSNNNGRLDKALRSRQFKLPEPVTVNGTVTMTNVTKEWRLGDVIHSTPIAVAKPAESYQYIYRDPTYGKFAAKWAGRRTMIYFGGNDGMLHAINGGFYAEINNQFCCAPLNADGTCSSPPVYGSCTSAPSSYQQSLGKEMWAYIPYNLQPHLKCLANTFYNHKYFVDQRPRIFDAQIFEEEAACSNLADPACVHPGGWGTILVGSMQFGGAPILANSLNGNTNDKRELTSSFFILDITNPEAEPELLGELSRTTEITSTGDKYADINYTTTSPTMIIMRDGAKGNTNTKWYLVFGNGPADLDGTNTSGKQGVLAVLPLEWLKGSIGSTGWTNGIPKAGSINGSKQAFRIPNSLPSSSSQGGVFPVPLANNGGYLSDLISVDYNVDTTAPDTLGARYQTDAVYFGTVDGTNFASYPATYLSGLADQKYWNGGGRIFRLVTKRGSVDSTTGNFVETASVPSDWASGWTNDSYSTGPVRMLADVKMPVVAAPSIGYDGSNYWIYAGTGRFYDAQDKTDNGWCDISKDATCNSESSRSKIGFFGLKEPLKDAHSSFSGWTPSNASSAACRNSVMTWGTIQWDINAKTNKDLMPSNAAGTRGLMQTDHILVSDAVPNYLACSNTENTSFQACLKVNGNNPCEDVNSWCFPGPSSSTNQLDSINDTSSSLSTGDTFPKLRNYIAGTGCTTQDSTGVLTGIDGWYRDFHDSRERNLGSATLLGGLLTFTTYQPFNDKCRPEGVSYLYGVHFQTGTAWTDTVFGNFSTLDSTGHQVYNTGGTMVMDRMSLGTGLSTTPSLHAGTGAQAAKAFIQTSTGEIVEINQQNLPISNAKSGRQNWTDRCQ